MLKAAILSTLLVLLLLLLLLLLLSINIFQLSIVPSLAI